MRREVISFELSEGHQYIDDEASHCISGIDVLSDGPDRAAELVERFLTLQEVEQRARKTAELVPMMSMLPVWTSANSR